MREDLRERFAMQGKVRELLSLSEVGKYIERLSLVLCANVYYPLYIFNRSHLVRIFPLPPVIKSG